MLVNLTYTVDGESVFIEKDIETSDKLIAMENTFSLFLQWFKSESRKEISESDQTQKAAIRANFERDFYASRKESFDSQKEQFNKLKFMEGR